MFSNSSTLDLANLHFLDMWIFWPPGNLNLALQRASHAPCPSSACGDGHYDLANVDPGHCALGLSKGTTHTCLEPISSKTGQHLVDAGDREGLEPHSDVEATFAAAFHHVLVGTNAGSLQGFGGELLILT